MKIAFLGPPGSFSHQAVLKQFPNVHGDALVPQKSIKGCVDAVQDAAVDVSVIPIENSTNGPVAMSYDFLRNCFFTNKLTSLAPQPVNFTVAAEQFVSIEHFLLTECTDLAHVKRIYSHPQVWTQCSNFFAKLHSRGIHVDKIDTDSTSRASQLVLEDIANGIHNTAAISSKLASELYGLPVLVPNIEDDKNNTTRFLVLDQTRNSNKLKSTDLNVPRQRQHSNMVTLAAARLGDPDPAAMSSFLSIFKENDVKVTNVTARPSQVQKWQYVYFVEMSGDTSSPGVAESLSAMKESATELQVLGHFERNPAYYNNTIELSK